MKSKHLLRTIVFIIIAGYSGLVFSSLNNSDNTSPNSEEKNSLTLNKNQIQNLDDEHAALINRDINMAAWIQILIPLIIGLFILIMIIRWYRKRKHYNRNSYRM